jgi:hypothetical protein
MSTATQPLQEIDRFFAAPRNGAIAGGDAQSQAVQRLVLRCERVRPHLQSAAALDALVRRQHDPARVRRRIALALAIELGDCDLLYSRIGLHELETFRSLALHKPAAVVWVFA